MRRGAAQIVGIGLAAATAGCGVINDLGPSTCDRSADGNPPVVYTEGEVDGGVYMSSDWHGELLYFPGGMRYEIHHHLDVAPRWWQLYLSFDRRGAETGTLAHAAGNQAEVRHVDNEKLLVVNGSCVEYWLLVVAGAGDEAPEGN